VAAYAAGALLGGHLERPGSLSTSERPRIAGDFLELSSCFGVPGLAFSLLFLWLVMIREGKIERSSNIAVAMCTMANFVVGYVAGRLSRSFACEFVR
jgi:hypothetical protein